MFKTHSTSVKCGSFQVLLVDMRYSRYWEHPCSFFSRAAVVIGEDFGGSLAMLFTSQNCLWATLGHHHNFVINKSIFRHSVHIYIYVIYICTCLSVIIHTEGVSEKSHSTSKYRNWTPATSVSALKVCLWENYAIDVTLSAKKKKSGLKMKGFLLSPVTSKSLV